MLRNATNLLITGTILLVLITLSHPSLSAQTADLLVVNKVPNTSGQPGSLSFIDYAAGKVVATVTVDREPHEVALTPDGKYALVANTGGYVTPNNTLSLVDVAARSVRHTVDLGALYTPHGLAYSKANGLFYFTVEGSRAIGAYDPEANEVAWIYGTGQAGSHMLLISEDGRTIVTANREDASVSILKLEGDDPLAAAAWSGTIVPVGERPEGLAFAPGEAMVWVGLRSGDGLVLVDPEEERVAERYPIAGHSVARLLFTPDGATLLAADPNEGSVLFIDPQTGAVAATVPVGSTAASLFLVPGGESVLVGVSEDDTIAEIDLATREVTRRLESGPDPDAMAWPDKE
ncbi:YVTN family beta-propeller protein [Neolewinella xylanilytica]|uniref:YVTN family beta-propeller protein n=1 Tax=Neolewinella xylanilytica TaxID=1514080 RepID=A0A2S6I976_9BACT|nr:YncE family protein [Neolewinella xylanilytica]PPK88043.1 YVTN family beta-propeller protein [Neolewinella xylanilytica]